MATNWTTLGVVFSALSVTGVMVGGSLMNMSSPRVELGAPVTVVPAPHDVPVVQDPRLVIPAAPRVAPGNPSGGRPSSGPTGGLGELPGSNDHQNGQPGATAPAMPAPTAQPSVPQAPPGPSDATPTVTDGGGAPLPGAGEKKPTLEKSSGSDKGSDDGSGKGGQTPEPAHDSTPGVNVRPGETPPSKGEAPDPGVTPPPEPTPITPEPTQPVPSETTPTETSTPAPTTTSVPTVTIGPVPTWTVMPVPTRSPTPVPTVTAPEPPVVGPVPTLPVGPRPNAPKWCFAPGLDWFNHQACTYGKAQK